MTLQKYFFWKRQEPFPDELTKISNIWKWWQYFSTPHARTSKHLFGCHSNFTFQRNSEWRFSANFYIMSIKLLAAGDGWFGHRIMARGGGCKIHVPLCVSKQEAKSSSCEFVSGSPAHSNNKQAHASRLLTSECCRNSARQRRELGLVATLMKNAHLGGINLAHQL